MMTAKKVFSIILLSATIFAAAGIRGTTFAQESCNLNQEKFAELEAIQNNFGLDPLLKIRQELAIRKSLLKDVVDCATEEILVLKSEFDGVKTTNTDVLTLKNQFSGWFLDVTNYYAIQKANIDNLGLLGSKDFAKSFSAWRDRNFNPRGLLIGLKLRFEHPYFFGGQYLSEVVHESQRFGKLLAEDRRS